MPVKVVPFVSQLSVFANRASRCMTTNQPWSITNTLEYYVCFRAERTECIIWVAGCNNIMSHYSHYINTGCNISDDGAHKVQCIYPITDTLQWTTGHLIVGVSILIYLYFGHR